jgi:hypothetical protein
MAILGVAKTTTPPPVRKSWPTNGQPDWGIADDVVFMQCLDEGGEDIAQPVDTVWVNDDSEDLVQKDSQTRVVRLNLIAYGPNGYSNLIEIRRAIIGGLPNLKSNKLFYIPSPDSPQRAPELFQGRWWERADLSLRFNNLMTFETGVKSITEVDVTVHANDPGDSTVVLESGIIVKKG